MSFSYAEEAITKDDDDVDSSSYGAAADINQNISSTEDAAPSSSLLHTAPKSSEGNALSCYVSAADTKQIQSTSAADDEENRKPDFPFFKERREPWFRLNIMAFLVCLASFLYFTVTIVQDFIKNRNDPPTATTLRNGISQSFPAMAFCIHRGLDPNPKRTQPDLQPLFASFDNGDDNILDITDQLKQIDCLRTPKNQKCWYLEGTFPAFDTKTCIVRRNGISVGFTFNLTEYSSEVSLLGIDGFLFEPQQREQFFGLACRNTDFKCSGDMLLNNDDNCEGDMSFESFFATTVTSNLIQLHRSETQASARCDTTIVEWNAATVAANVNPNFLESLNVTVTDSASTVLMDFQFFSTDIVKTTYNPQSGVSMFGSLSGWFGFLSDGWGILSLLFIVEEIITYSFHFR